LDHNQRRSTLSPITLSTPEVEEIIVDQTGMRIDAWLAKKFPQRSRSYIQELIEKGFVARHGCKVKKRNRVEQGEVISVQWIPRPDSWGIVPEPLSLDLLFEDESILVVNKPPHMVVYPAPGHPNRTLANGLVHYLPQLERLDRSGIVHRLDSGTSGIMVVAKNREVQSFLFQQFSERKVEKEYIAICRGIPHNQTINTPVGRDPHHRKKQKAFFLREGGKEAVSHLRTLASDRGLSALSIRIETGRTHQIRVHCQAINHPIVGDGIYGDNGDRPLLHAYRLRLKHPHGGWKEYFAPLPEDISGYAERIHKGLAHSLSNRYYPYQQRGVLQKKRD